MPKLRRKGKTPLALKRAKAAKAKKAKALAKMPMHKFFWNEIKHYSFGRRKKLIQELQRLHEKEEAAKAVKPETEKIIQLPKPKPKPPRKAA